MPDVRFSHMAGAQEDTIPFRFEQQALRTPDRTAVMFASERRTFTELNQLSNRIAHRLLTAGLELEDRVGIFVDRSIESIAAILGIVKAGGAYVPLDPSYPDTMLRRIGEQSGVRFAIAGGHRKIPFPVDRSGVLFVGEAALWQVSSDNPAIRVLPENLAYVLFTSGSSGRPKGVMVEHRSVVNLLDALRERIYSQYARSVRVGLNASLMFDAAVKQWIQLLDGHTVCILPEEIRRSAHFWEYVSQEEVDLIDCTPSQLRYTLTGATQATRTGPLTVLVGGEAIDPAMWKAFQARPGIDFYNVYGPTECTVDVTVCKVREATEPSLGSPLLNVQVNLLDKDMEGTPVGTIGELYVGGAGVSRGYLSEPGQTAESFVPDPFSGIPGSRLYRTGDLACWTGGQLGFQGRADEQIKVSGYRIELTEIAYALRQLDQVRDAVVLLSEDQPAQIIAFVIFAPAAKVGLEGLKGQLAGRLPFQMMPRRIVEVDSWPLTRNGKLDRLALLELRRSSDTSAAVSPGPHGKLESALTEIWEQVLGLREIDPAHNFFDLGGDSFQLGIVYERVRQTLYKEITITELFEYPTIQTLGEHLRAGKSNAAPAEQVESRARRRVMAAKAVLSGNAQ